MIYYDIKQSMFNYTTLIAHTQKGICAILLQSFDCWDLEYELEKLFPNEKLQIVYSPQYALKIIKQLETNQKLNEIKIDFRCGTPFQRLVWESLRKIPAGTTITYSELANQIGMPRAIRAVATACARNPISIVIPCHRVVPKSGGIGKYRWGTEMKHLLINREQNEK